MTLISLDMEGIYILFSAVFRKWMQEEGMKGSLDFDVGEFLDKTFITYRKTKSINEDFYMYRYSFFNFITKHYTRNANDIY
jgi:hypothetical protein